MLLMPTEYQNIIDNAGISPAYLSDDHRYTLDDVHKLIEYMIQTEHDDAIEELQELRVALIDKTLTSMMESHVEYEESHQDAGDNYAHMPQESANHMCSTRCQELIDYCDDYISRFDTAGYRPTDKRFASDVLSELLETFNMVAGNRFLSSVSGFVLDSYCVGEVETQIELQTIAHDSGIDRDVVESILRSDPSIGNQFCITYSKHDTDCLLAYQSSDVVWYAVSDDEQIREAITKVCIDRCERQDKNRKDKINDTDRNN